MTFSENDQDDFYVRRPPTTPVPSSMKPQRGKQPAQQRRPSRNQSSTTKETAFDSANNFSPTVSWPILLAVVPTLGAFFAGSADAWSDFVMILLILYYVYKWLTVPWSYYESARLRSALHRNANSMPINKDEPDYAKQLAEFKRRKAITNELKRHELFGLLWVTSSPILAGITLHYSRYFLANYERYMSSFNVVVFVLAASLKPLAHAMTLLRERTLYLQSEIQTSESQVQMLQRKLDLMEEELDTLRKAFATKKDLGQVTEGLNPTIQQLAKTLKRFEKKENALRSWSEDRFSVIEQKVSEFDQYICYRVEQEQRQSAHGVVVTLIFLPFNVVLWAAKSMTGFLPVPRALLGSTASDAGDKKSLQHHHHTSLTRHVTHPDATRTPSIKSGAEPLELSYSTGDESVAAFGMSRGRSLRS